MWVNSLKNNKYKHRKIMANGSPKQKIVQSIKDATNILVTVSTNPSVDELTATQIGRASCRERV